MQKENLFTKSGIPSKKAKVNYFTGKISWLPIVAKQCEGICFDGETILISNEQRDLFELSTDQLIVVKN